METLCSLCSTKCLSYIKIDFRLPSVNWTSLVVSMKNRLRSQTHYPGSYLFWSRTADGTSVELQQLGASVDTTLNSPSGAECWERAAVRVTDISGQYNWREPRYIFRNKYWRFGSIQSEQNFTEPWEGVEWVTYWALFEQAQIGTPVTGAAAVTCTKSYKHSTHISWILEELGRWGGGLLRLRVMRIVCPVPLGRCIFRRDYN
jgi:hypothetical protein